MPEDLAGADDVEDDRGDDQGEDERRQDEEEVGDPHDDRVRPASDEPRHDPEQGPDDERHDGGQEADEHRDPGAVDGQVEDVTAEVVGPQEMLRRRRLEPLGRWRW